MRFAVSDAAAHERSRTGRETRVNNVHIESNGVTARRLRRDFIASSTQASIPRRSMSLIVKKFPRIPSSRMRRFSRQIQISRADVRAKFRIEFRREAFEIDQSKVRRNPEARRAAFRECCPTAKIRAC
jgi:hypothetical protein